VTTASKDAGKVLKAIIGVMGQATKNTITDAEVQRAKYVTNNPNKQAEDNI